MTLWKSFSGHKRDMIKTHIDTARPVHFLCCFHLHNAQLALVIVFAGVLMSVSSTELLGGRVATDDAISQTQSIQLAVVAWELNPELYLALLRALLPLHCAAARWVTLLTWGGLPNTFWRNWEREKGFPEASVVVAEEFGQIYSKKN